MSNLTATYTFEGDEIFAIHEGSVIASGTDMDAVESDATKYLDGLKDSQDKDAKEKAKKKASHIITPNGVEGEILGRVPTVWGEQVTARFANGTITTFEVQAESQVEWVSKRQASTATDPADALEQRLNAEFARDKRSLTARVAELDAIADEATEIVREGAPYLAEVKLDQIKTAASAERRMVREALEHLDAADAESFIPEAPFQMGVSEQADLGGHANSWLDVTTQQMIEESEGQDFDKLIDEGPSVFVTDLDTGALADSGVTREMAYSHVMARTAGFQGEEIEAYRERFVARTEVARRQELAARKTTNHKEAAAAEEVLTGTTDEALFM